MREVAVSAVKPGDCIIYNHHLTDKNLAHLQEYCDVNAIATDIATRALLLFVNANTETPLVMPPTEKVLIIPRQREPIE